MGYIFEYIEQVSEIWSWDVTHICGKPTCLWLDNPGHMTTQALLAWNSPPAWTEEAFQKQKQQKNKSSCLVFKLFSPWPGWWRIYTNIEPWNCHFFQIVSIYCETAVFSVMDEHSFPTETVSALGRWRVCIIHTYWRKFPFQYIQIFFWCSHHFTSTLHWLLTFRLGVKRPFSLHQPASIHSFQDKQ